MAYVFDCVPSRLDAVFWSNTMLDLRTAIKLKVGFQTVKMTQEYLSLLRAAGAIFGGESGGKQNSKAKVPETEEEAMRLAAAVFG